MPTVDALYEEVGSRIRAARERHSSKVSQASLAKKLGVSRASIVNIEAGRQRAPLTLLWRIAVALDTELAMLIPRRSELTGAGAGAGASISDAMRRHIKEKAAGDDGVERDLTTFVGQLLATARTTKSPSRGGR